MMLKLLCLFSLLFSTLLHAQNPVKAQILESQKIAQEWLAFQKRGLSQRDLFAGQAERAKFIIQGIAPFAKLINPKNVVFRHYIGSNMALILQSSQLKTGITPYIIYNPGYSREIYEDMVGIFLTTPLTPPERVGLAANPMADYIDFTLYEGTPVFQVEPEILIIPGRKDYPQWLGNLYKEYQQSGRASAEYLEIFRRIDEEGGIHPTFMTIKIKSYRMNGRVINL